MLVPDIVLMGDPRVSAVPVRENAEPLVDLRAHRQFLLDARRADPQGAFAQVRQGLVQRLIEAQQRLPAGLRLLIVEGYRPAALQATYFDAYRRSLLDADPGLAGDDADRLASRYVSPPSVAPHVSGAAVDLTLADGAGVELNMGTPVNASPEESDGGCYTAAANICDVAARNRALLTTALQQSGLVNYPTEWWHWSFGDRYWAMQTGASHALYGTITGS